MTADALVIGGGPAGLMAADVISQAGYRVILADQMPTLGRKFLMAGKSGLNLTKAEPLPAFLTSYGSATNWLAPMVSAMGPQDVGKWAEDLGQTVFTGSTGRVFPTVMKASPLLRAWLARLDAQGVRVHTRWQWTGWQGAHATFNTPDGPEVVSTKLTVLALGGASWKRLGSDGAWTGYLPDAVASFQPANMGFVVPWSSHMAPHFGSALKGCRLVAGEETSMGEFVISKTGIEGGGVYAVSAAVRDGAGLSIDLLPNLSQADINARMERVGPKTSAANVLRKAFKLDPAKRALFNELGRDDPRPLAEKLKSLSFPPLVPRPMDEAISTAGGVRSDAMTADLELKDRPGVFCAGEMLDWEAPTGGYLITGCLATGRWAGLAAVQRLQTS